jgi:lipoyl(octanoyl) transferase
MAKIAALGVHLRRHVSALGTAVNVDFPAAAEEVRDEARNPWARIVACGLEGKTVTSVAGELRGGVEEVDQRLAGLLEEENSEYLPAGYGREAVVAGAWAQELARRLGLDGVDVVGVEEAVRLMGDLLAAAEPGEDASVEREVKFLEGVVEVLSGRTERDKTSIGIR